VMNERIHKAIEFFYAKKFTHALALFALELSENKDAKEARIGALLCDMALENEEQARSLFEYYLLTKDNGVEECEAVMETLIHSVDENRDKIARLLGKNNDFEQRLNAENGIRYEDFRDLIDSRGSFKEAFEDIMFSTKVIISRKEDFVDFLSKLMENGFVDISLNYLESAVTLFPNDEQLLTLIKKVQH